MNRRKLIRGVLAGQPPPYVPWSMGFTLEAKDKLRAHYGIGPDDDSSLATILDNHLAGVGSGVGFFTDLGDDRVQDVFGVIWDRRVDKDIGIVSGQVLPAPTLTDYAFPDPLAPVFFDGIEAQLALLGDQFKVFHIGFSLYERAWTLRGMEALLMDFHDHPRFVHELLNTIADWNIAQVRKAVTYDIDAIYFGDDWGQQRGLQMGPKLWYEFIYPPLRRMYTAVKEAGKYIFIHSCGDVDELFDDLVAIGLDCFNPFQPEVMDVFPLMQRHRGRLTFHGGMSTQHTLPYGSVEEVRAQTRRLLEAGSGGNYIFAPAHAVEGDVPVENIVAMIETVQAQPAYQSLRS